MPTEEALARLRAAVPGNVREVCARLHAAGHQAVTVGGAVRDALLGRTPGDWDVATAAVPDQVMALFRHTIPTGLQHGTVTIVTGRGIESHVEVTTFRGEGAYTDARRPDHVRFGVPLVEDLARRDFRVNAMAYDPATDELIDPYAGLADLDERVLRAVGPTGDPYTDAVARFTEDGLRVMRAVRFCATLGFALDPETERGIGPALPSLAKVSKERICEELRKTLAREVAQPSRALRIAQRSGIIAVFAPALASRLGDVDHWCRRVDVAHADARLGAVFAELAPAEPVKRLDRDAVKAATDVLKALKFANDEVAVAATLVGLRPTFAAKAWAPAEARRLLADVTRPRVAAALALFRAEAAAGGSPETLALAELVAAVEHDPICVAELAIAGKDLLTELKMTPGRAVGRLLEALVDRVLEDPALNTREALLAVAQPLELQLAR